MIPAPGATTMTPKEFFAENGYYLTRGIFPAAMIGPFEEDFDRIVNQISGPGDEANVRWAGPEMERLNAAATTVVHTHNVQQFSGHWMNALLHAPFLDVVEELIGPDIILHHTKLFMKPPGRGAPFPMHQDWTYFPMEKDSMIAGVIHLSEATDEMGCFRIYPGSHKLGRIEGSSGMEKSEFLERHPIEKATVVEAERGDILFFHYCLLHGSMPNKSQKTRKTVLVQMHAGDDAVEEGCPHPEERLVLRGFNHRIGRTRAGAKK